MSGYTISITGNSNDSDLVLSSSAASITENGSSNLVPLTGRVNTLETSMNSLEINELKRKMFENPVSDGSISIGMGDLNFDPNTAFLRDSSGYIIDGSNVRYNSVGFNPSTAVIREISGVAVDGSGNIAQNELEFSSLYAAMMGNYQNPEYFFARIDIVGEFLDPSYIVGWQDSSNSPVSAGELNYMSVTSRPKNATANIYYEPSGILQMEAWNGTKNLKENGDSTPSRKVVYFSTFNKWDGLASISYNDYVNNFSNYAGIFVTFNFTIKNIDTFVNWFVNKLVPFCNNNSWYVLLNTPSNLGINIGGDLYNMKWLETKGLGYGSQVITIGNPAGTRADLSKTEFTNLYNTLKTEQTENFTLLTDQYQHYTSSLVSSEQLALLNDGTYSD